MQKAGNLSLAGTIAMGLFLSWVGYTPFYGPALAGVNITGCLYPDLFLAAHVAGLLGASYCYARYDRAGLLTWASTALPIVLALLTLTLLFASAKAGPVGLSFIFSWMGLASGWVAGRWLAWFSSAPTAGRRGSILGRAFGLSMLLIAAATWLQIQFARGLSFTLLLSALVIAAAGFFIHALPLPTSRAKPFTLYKLKNAMPSSYLILFALFGYPAIALTYRLVISWELQEPVLPWLMVLPYMATGFFLGARTDRSGRKLFLILALLSSGFGFLFLTIFNNIGYQHVIIAVLINTGFLFMRLYFWLSLVDQQNTALAPLSLAVGISIEIALFGLVCSITDVLLPDPDTGLIMIGLLGVSLILFSFAAFTALSGSFHGPPTGELLLQRQQSNNLLSTGSRDDSLVPISHHMAMIDRARFEQAVISNLQLTKREAAIAYMMAVGYSNAEICEIYDITANTLRFHLKNIYSKLAVSSRGQAVKKLYDTVCYLTIRSTPF